MATTYQLTAKSVRKLARSNRRVEKLPNNIRQPFPNNNLPLLPAAESQLWAYNDTGDEIPAYAVMGVISTRTIDDNGTLLHIVNVEQPTTTFRRQYVVNGPLAIPSDLAQRIPTGPFVKAEYTGSAPSRGDGLGPVPSSWTLAANYPQSAIVEGVIDSDNKIVLVRWQLVTSGVGKANGTIANRASGAISIWQGTLGSESEISSMDPTAFNIGPALASGDWVGWDHWNGQMICFKLCDGA